MELEQRGGIGATSLGIPGATVNIDRADNMFDINNKEAVGGNQGDVNFVFALGRKDFKVVNQGIGIGQVIAQKGDRPTFRFVLWLTDRNNLRHSEI